MSFNRQKSNWAKLCCLISEHGAETMRKYLDSVHSPANLPAVLNANRTMLNGLRGIKVINQQQMDLLFPSSGVTKSSDYDVSLLFILIRNICGLYPPVTTGSWDAKPPLSDKTPEANLVRIKYYRNKFCHGESTEVSDTDFNMYWSEIQDALVDLGASTGDIAKLKMGPLDKDLYIKFLKEWYEKDNKTEVFAATVLKVVGRIGEDVKKIASDLNQRREKDGRIEHLGNKIFEKTETVEEDVKKMASDLNECHEKDGKIEHLGNKIFEKAETIETIVNSNTSNINLIIMIAALCLLALLLFFPVYFGLFSHSGIEEVVYTDRQNFSNPRFVGRDWLFRELEKILNESKVRGVQLAIDPGWGKSEIMKRLIYTSNSSAVIHENIIGYHFCKYSEPSTRDGEKFVKDLVKLIAKKIDEFREIIDNDQLIKDELQFNCKKPMECFQKAIVEPLQRLNATGRNNSFILIDALDECWEKEEGHKNSIIVNILSSSDHVPKLPNWVKLIVTSRNQAQATGKMLKIRRLKLLPINLLTHPGNLQDLHNYAEQALQIFYSEVPSMEEKLPLNRLIDLAVKFSKGNFLFLDRIITFWQTFPEKINPKYIPENVEDIYEDYFAARFKEADLASFQPLLEVLLASNSPLTVSELDKILNYHYKNYDTRSNVLKLSEYFKSDIDQGPLEFHHQLFAEWLSKQTHGSNGIVIQISKGHQYIVDYLFNFYSERETDLTYHELKELCIHILHRDKASVSNRRKLSSLKVSEVREKFTNRTILHDLALRNDSTGLIDVLIKQFEFVDILDRVGKTPAMYAVEAGNYENLKLFIDNGANVSYTRYLYFACDISMFFNPLSNIYRYAYNSMYIIAIYKGYTRIAELLIESGAEIEQAEVCGYTALHLAVLMGRFEIVQLYIKKTQPDLVSLHHAAASNQTKIVQLLLKTGIRDECLPRKPMDYISCAMNVNHFHHCICETALHAAVSRNNLEMAELILQYGNASVNCKHGSGLTPLMEAFSRNNTQIVELLISAGADINAQCESSILKFVYCSFVQSDFMYSSFCNQLVCNGSRPIDFIFAHGLWETMIPFMQSKGKLKASLNNLRRSPTTTAAIYDQIDFIKATYGKKLNSLPNIETTLHYVAVCNSVQTLKYLLNNIVDLSKFTAVYNDGKTLFHFSTLGSSKPKTGKYATKSCAFSACVCPNMASFDITEEKRLETVGLLLKVIASDINKQDTYGRTALHYAAVRGLPKLVEYLLNEGADWSIEDQRGDTALEYALREKPVVSTGTFLPCRLTSDQMFQVCQSTPFDELANYLLQNATIKKCDTRAKSLLRGLLRHKLPLSLYEMFKSGFDVNCAREQFREYLLHATNRLHFSWSWYVLEVFKIFQFNIKVACDVAFKESELHLIAYLRKLWHPRRNFSQLAVPFQLERFIATHPKGVEILNECYDKEGYLPIHRAVQGRNIDAVSWFIEIGVDLSKKTKSNITSLVLASVSTDIKVDLRCIINPLCNRNCVFNKLLEKMKEKNHTVLQCNTERIDLSPLHIVGMRGMAMLEMVHRILPTIPLNCTNSHGIHPIYLVYLYNATGLHISDDDIEAFDNLRRSLDIEFTKNPEREAEYHLIYNKFYRTPQKDLRNMLSHEGLFECPGINEMLPNKTEIKEYKLKACVARCWPSAFEASREFSSNFPHVDIQNFIFNPFTDKFVDIAHHMAKLQFHLVKMFRFSLFHCISNFTLEKELWRKVKKAHSCARTCSCFEIMELLQEAFTSEPRFDYEYVGKFVGQRMGWSDTSLDGDVMYRWPFSFLLKKALRTDKAYKYLEILDPYFNYYSIEEATDRLTY